MGAHHCHAEGCSVAVPPRMFACRRHWAMVPGWLQRALWAVYQPGQEVSKRVTVEYVLVQSRCRLAIAEAERNADAIAKVERYLGEKMRDLLATGAPDRAMTDRQLIDAFFDVLGSQFGAPKKSAQIGLFG